MRTWLVFENVCNSLGNEETSSENNANASWLKGTLHRRFSRESLCENEKYVFLQRSLCTPVITAFQENPGARMKNIYFCKDLRAPLSSPLFKRILQREYEKCPRPMVAKDPCHRHFYRESCSENQKSKNSKQKQHATIQTRNRKPRQQKAPVGGPMFYLRLKETFFKMYEIP